MLCYLFSGSNNFFIFLYIYQSFGIFPIIYTENTKDTGPFPAEPLLEESEGANKSTRHAIGSRGLIDGPHRHPPLRHKGCSFFFSFLLCPFSFPFLSLLSFPYLSFLDYGVFSLPEALLATHAHHIAARLDMHLAEVKQTQKMQERDMEQRVRGREVRREDDNLGAGEHKGTTKRGLGRGSNRSTKQTREGRRELKQGLNEKELEVQKQLVEQELEMVNEKALEMEQQKVQA